MKTSLFRYILVSIFTLVCAITLTSQPKWQEKDGIIYFSVTSDGTNGEEWITRLEKQGIRISINARRLLLSPGFTPTKGVKTEIAILKGETFSDSDRVAEKIRAEAGKRKFSAPNAEVACLIREIFTDGEIVEMGLLSIVTMSELIRAPGGSARFCTNLFGDGLWLIADYTEPNYGWDREDGFAFAVSQVKL